MQTHSTVSNVNPASFAILQIEIEAAHQSIASGVYITFLPNRSSSLPNSASDELINGIGQCCRVGSKSICLCGHALDQHVTVVVPKKIGYIKPPKCSTKFCRCISYSYCPSRPEECGQWWLPRRKDFNIIEWQKVLLFLYIIFTLCNIMFIMYYIAYS